MSAEDLSFYRPPELKSRLHLAPELYMEFTHEIPNWWFRLWCRVFFGWHWEEIK